MIRTVVFAGVPSFYAEVERAAEPALRERPVVVGGNPKKRGLVQSATADALASGVEPGMTVIEALERCPEARALRTNMKRYREVSLRLRACFSRDLETVEPVGLDAAYLDGTGAGRPVTEIATRLRLRVADELGLPLQVGIASARFLARLAAEDAGPGGVRRIGPGEERKFLHDLPVSRLPGVGPRIAEQLRELAVATAGELARVPSEVVETRLGNHGLGLLQLSQGHGDARVRAAWHPQSFHQETTLAPPQLDQATLADLLLELSQGLEESLRLQGLAARRVALRVRFEASTNQTRSQTQERGLRRAGEIHRVALELLGRTHAGDRAVRHLALAVSQMQPAGAADRQLELFEGE